MGLVTLGGQRMIDGVVHHRQQQEKEGHQPDLV
jgi:hypothetical protein